MAFSATRKRRFLAGSVYKEIWNWDSAGVTTGTFSVGVSNVDHISPNNNVTEDVGKWTSSGSVVTVSGVTSGDTGTVEITGI